MFLLGCSVMKILVIVIFGLKKNEIFSLDILLRKWGIFAPLDFFVGSDLPT